MPRLAAFLRAINVGGHTVKMGDLKRLFEGFGFSGVETFIASGNVLFDSRPAEAAALERKIEKGLREALGYEVATFIRSGTELSQIVHHQAFPASDLAKAAAFNIAFLKEPPDEDSREKVFRLITRIDNFHFHGRELYWLCLKKQSEATFSNAVLEKTLGRPSTLRGAATVEKIAVKF